MDFLTNLQALLFPQAQINGQKGKSLLIEKMPTKKIEELGFKENTFFEDTFTADDIRNEILIALSKIKKECDYFPHLRKVRKDFTKMLKSKTDSADKLASLRETLVDIIKQAYSKKDDGESEEDDWVLEYNTASTLEQLLYPIYVRNLEASSRNVLQLSESIIKSYPEKHSFFASTVQEATSGHYSKIAASEIRKGSSIENALLRAEQIFRGNQVIPQVPTHRLSKFSTKDEEKNFEVLFITGSVYEDEDQDKFTKGRDLMLSSIKETHGDRCKDVAILDEPSLEELEETLKEVSNRIKEHDRKLYIIYDGHGDKESPQIGISREKAKKQGAEEFIFVLNENSNLSEETIKDLYNKYFKDIEVITIFNSCHSGAGITAIENEELKRHINFLA